MKEFNSIEKIQDRDSELTKNEINKIQERIVVIEKEEVFLTQEIAKIVDNLMRARQNKDESTTNSLNDQYKRMSIKRDDRLTEIRGLKDRIKKVQE